MKAVAVRVPGKIFLAGEYDVLQGGPSLSATVDRWLRVTVRPDTQMAIYSQLWSEPLLLPQSEPVEAAAQSAMNVLARKSIPPARIEIESELDVRFGLGSSSAVRLGIQLALHAFADQSVAIAPELAFAEARYAWEQQKTLQGFASGYDLLTQFAGGLIRWTPDYTNWPGPYQKFSSAWLSDWVHPYIGGKGAPTAAVGGSVRQWLNTNDLWQPLSERSRDLVAAFESRELGAILAANAKHRELFLSAPAYPLSVYKALASLPGFDQSWSFKTTGAGGEDAVLLLGPRSALGEAQNALAAMGWQELDAAWTDHGCQMQEKEA